MTSCYRDIKHWWSSNFRRSKETLQRKTDGFFQFNDMDFNYSTIFIPFESTTQVFLSDFFTHFGLLYHVYHLNTKIQVR